MYSLSARRRVLTLPKCSDASEAILGISNLFVVKPSVRKLAMWGPQRMQESQLDFLRRGPSHTSDPARVCLAAWDGSVCSSGSRQCEAARNQALFIKSLRQTKSQFEQITVKHLRYTFSLCLPFCLFLAVVFFPIHSLLSVVRGSRKGGI